MNADMFNRGTEDRPLSLFRGGGRTSPPPPSGSATGSSLTKYDSKRATSYCSGNKREVALNDKPVSEELSCVDIGVHT